MTTKQRIIEYFIKHPTATVKSVAVKYNLSIPYIYGLRKQAMKEAQERNAAEVLGPQIDEAVNTVDRSWDEVPRAKDRQVGGDHYLEMGVEPWDVVDTWPFEERVGFYRGNALKYIMRIGRKDTAATEAGKAQHYIQKLIEVCNAAR